MILLRICKASRDKIIIVWEAYLKALDYICPL